MGIAIFKSTRCGQQAMSNRDTAIDDLLEKGYFSALSDLLPKRTRSLQKR